MRCEVVQVKKPTASGRGNVPHLAHSQLCEVAHCDDPQKSTFTVDATTPRNVKGNNSNNSQR